MALRSTLFSLITLMALSPQFLGAIWDNPQPPAPPVYVEKVAQQDISLYYTTVGTLAPGASVKVVARVDGTITKIHVKEGETAEEGQVLLSLDGQKHRVKLQESKAALQEQEAALQYAEIQFAKAEQLYKEQAISEKEFRVAKEKIELSRAKVAMVQAREKAAQIAFDQLEVKAPISGRVGEFQRGRGNYIKTNELLTTIDEVTKLDVEFAVPERRFQAFREELSKGELECKIWLPHVQEQVFEAQVDFFQNRVSKETGTIGLRASVANPDGFLWPGQFVKVQLLLETLKDATVVPLKAIRRNENGPYVFVLDQENKAELRPVKLGAEKDNFRVIKSGLEPGETVIVEGQLNVWPGITVDVKEKSAEKGE